MTMPQVPVAPGHLRRTVTWIGVALALVVACAAPMLSATAGRSDGKPGTTPADLPVAPLATVQDLMRYEVDANADPIWDAVGSITTATGTENKRPRTDAEWEAVRRHAVVLLEATNLLVIPGRKVSAAPFPSDGPGVLGSREIQQRIDRHHAQFNAHALALRAVVASELQAIDTHDAKTLQSLGENMDAACESCHVGNWYPHEVIPELPAMPPPPKGDFKAHVSHD